MNLFHRLSLLAVPLLLVAVTSSAAPPAEVRSRVVDAFAKLPLRFERREVGLEIGAYDATRTLVIDPVLEYSTFLGGALNEEAFGVAVDAEGSAYVTGPTDSLAFPKSILLNA